MSCKTGYDSPRISAELLDCSMPMTLDTYSFCSGDCQYCFSYFQHQNLRLSHAIKSIDPNRVKKIFLNGLKWKPTQEKFLQGATQFYPFIRNRKVVQWGGLNDQFDLFERKFGVTLDLLHFFDKIDYPLSFSTKFDWWTKDERYLELFQKHVHNWHVKFSIITYDKDLAAKVERRIPTPQERLDAMKRISDLGINTTLRLRPVIPIVSASWKELISAAKEHGANSVSSEFLCIESRANQQVKSRINNISKAIDFDLIDFYRKNSTGSGYRRLNPKVKQPIFQQMKQHCDSIGLNLVISDAFWRDLNTQPNCCGVPKEWNSATGHFGNAILVAKEKGKVHWKDIEPEVRRLFSKIPYARCSVLNTTCTKYRAHFRHHSIADYFRTIWNNPDNSKSPHKMYGKILVPIGKDQYGDVVYFYRKL